MIQNYIIVRFNEGVLNYNKLLDTYEDFYYSFKQKGKHKPLDGGAPFPSEDDDERGFPDTLRYLLMTEKFCLTNPSSNIVLSPALKSFLVMAGATCIQRLTTASPYDTLSVTRTGDTIGCDHYRWMVINKDSSVNALELCYALRYLFPNEISLAAADYETRIPLRHPCDDQRNYDTCEFGVRSMINTEKAWDFEVGDPDVLMAHYDEGVDYRHPDLGGAVGMGNHVRYAKQYYIPDAPQTPALPFQNSGHGTPCAGIMGALTNRNAHSVAGVAGGWSDDLQGTGCDATDRGMGSSLVVLANNSRSASRYYVSAVFEAAARSAVTQYGFGVHVINTSERVSGDGLTEQPLHAAINYAFENGVVQTAAIFQQETFPHKGLDEGLLPHPVSYPADYDEPWIINVGGSIPNKNKTPPSDFGYTMDLLAPSGDPGPQGNWCFAPDPGGNWSVNWTTHSDWANPTPTFFFSGFGGNSAAAPHVAGSAALLLSWFHRGSDTFFGLEPEDYAGILKASAWRGDTNRTNDTITMPSPINTWRALSGYGHLDIGRAFEMLDPMRLTPHGGYEPRHYHFEDSLEFGDWKPEDQHDTTFFDISWSPKVHTNDSSFIKQLAHRTYLLNYQGAYGYGMYETKSRVVTRTVTLDSIWEINAEAPLFAWGRSGGLDEKSGWSSAQFNWQTGWSRVTSGTGGNAFNEGIFHSHSRMFTVSTIQYDVWAWDKPSKTFSNYIGHVPPDSMMGVNFTVFGRVRPEFSDVEEQKDAVNSSLSISANSNNIFVRFDAPERLVFPKLEVYDILGRLVTVYSDISGNEGLNSFTIPAKLPAGTYIGRLTCQNFVQAKSFQVIR